MTKEMFMKRMDEMFISKEEFMRDLQKLFDKGVLTTAATSIAAAKRQGSATITNRLFSMDWIYESKVLAALRYFMSLHEADGVVELINDPKHTAEDVVDYIKWCERRYKEDKDTDIDDWYNEKE